MAINRGIPSAKSRAVALIQGNELLLAKIECARLAKRNRNDPESWFLLGVVNSKLGEIQEAISCYKKTLKLTSGQHAESYNHLGLLYQHQGSPDKAIKCFTDAIRINPNIPEVHNNLGVALQRTGQYEYALSSYQRALHLRPAFIEASYNIGSVLEHLNQPIKALAVYLEVFRLNPKFPIIIPSILRIFNDFQNWVDSERFLESISGSTPNNPYIHYHLGNLYWVQKRWNESEYHFRKTLDYLPDFTDAWVGLGNALQDKGQQDEARRCYVNALDLEPASALARYNLGALDLRQNRLVEALEGFNLAINQQPDFVNAHWHKAFVCLLLGDYSQGWKEYEWRHRRSDNRNVRPFRKPAWDGSDLCGQTILVHDEQGCGDTFQFVRFLPLVKARGGRVVFECRRGLGNTLKGCKGYDIVLERSSYQDVPDIHFDVHAYLMSLPGLFHITPNNIPAEIPYITPDAHLIVKWKKRLAEENGFRVGIAWAGSPGHTNEGNRSCRLDDFSPIAQIPNVTLYSLQKGEESKQADHPPQTMQIIRLDREIDVDRPFVDTAAVMENLDLVITIDTSIAHLAGALGCRVWVLLCATPDWRWGLEGSETPWYPSMRLFRQRRAGQWDGVFEQVADALARLIATHGR